MRVQAHGLAASAMLGLLGDHVLGDAQPELALQGRVILGPVGHDQGQVHAEAQGLHHRILHRQSSISPIACIHSNESIRQ